MTSRALSGVVVPVDDFYHPIGFGLHQEADGIVDLDIGFHIGIIEDSDRPGFHYQIPERWLSEQTPPENKPVAVKDPVYLSIATLDRMVQMILTKKQSWRAAEDEPNGEQQSSRTDLGTDAGEKQGALVPEAILPGTHKSRRKMP